MAGSAPDSEGLYERYVTQAKDEARNGNLEESLKFFNLANEIHPSEKLRNRIKRLEETLAELALATEEEEGFVDVCNSGLMIYGEMYNKLFEYQREGVAFLYSLYCDGRQGGILADDMGLGKTIQIIAFLSGMFDAELIKFVLLVMPTTLVSNWMKEFAKWTPGMRVKDFHGTSKIERNRKLERIQRKNGIVITTYQMLINNWQQLSSFSGREFVWDYIILDEAHKIKTPSAKTTKAVYAIPAKNRILLTGTPVQNNLREMWSLFDFACQGSLLGTAKTFKMEYENPITRAREKDATPGEKALGLKISENLMTIIKPYFLRRTKEDVQKYKSDKKETHLPDEQSKNVAPEMPSLTRKNDFIVWVYLAPVQEEIYRNFLSLDHVKEVLMTTRSPLAELNILKKLCDHPRLLSARACAQLGLEEGGYSEQDQNEGDAFSGANKIDHLSDEVLIEESGKLLFLMGLLERLQEEGHRTLVFSQSRKMLDIIERILTHRRFKTMRIDGTVTHLMERERRINMFQHNKDYSVFLLTTQVGGVGITLTAASRVVIFDPSWNPATDAQAVDRAYRIGQKENVVIYRLITCGTVEEKIYRRQVFKDSLIRQTTGDKKNPFRYFTKQELRELFTLGDTQTSATQIQLQSLHASQRKTDLELDEHIAYLHSLKMFGISDHDLMYTRETQEAQEEQAETEEAHQYIQQRVQKAQELVQLESQLKDQLAERIKSDTEGAWLRPSVLSSQPKKKSPEFHTRHLLPPVLGEPTNDDAIDLAENGAVGNVSARMTSLIIVDSGDEQLAEDVSNMDISEPLPSSKILKQPDIQDSEQNLNTNFIPSSFGVDSLGNKESHSCEPRRDSHRLLVNSQSINDVQITSPLHSMSSFNESVIGDKQRNAEMSLQICDSITNPGDDGKENPELTSPLPSKNLLTITSKCPSEFHKSYMSESSLEGTSGTSQYQADFNLVLEDSEDGQGNISKREKLLGYTEDAVFDLKAGSHCSSAMNSWVEHDDFGNSYNVAKGNLNDSIAVSEALMESSEITATGKKWAKRIVSDDEDEDEDNSIMILDENLPEKMVFPLYSPLSPSLTGISSSTPKCTKVIGDPIFSPSGNRSTASRRSLINVVLDQVEDVEETMGALSQAEDSDEVQEELVVEEAEEHSVESVEPDAEPTGETLDTSVTASYLDDTESEADEIEEEYQEESTGDPELLSGEQIDCFSKDNAGQKDVIQTTLDSLHAPDNYDALIECGRKLKDNGKLQDALNCFLQALDIKNGDPEVMLITLNLYKQLSQK